jgi:hypothetical protein
VGDWVLPTRLYCSFPMLAGRCGYFSCGTSYVFGHTWFVSLYLGQVTKFFLTSLCAFLMVSLLAALSKCHSTALRSRLAILQSKSSKVARICSRSTGAKMSEISL